MAKDIKEHNELLSYEENGYFMTITPVDNKGLNNSLTIIDCHNNNQSMLVGTIIKIPTNVSNEIYQEYKRKMIHLYETFGICSVAQNPTEFDGTYNKVA